MYMYEYGHRRQNREKRRRTGIIATQDPPLPVGLPCIATHSRSHRGRGRPHPGHSRPCPATPSRLHPGNGQPQPAAPSRTLAEPWQRPVAHKPRSATPQLRLAAPCPHLGNGQTHTSHGRPRLSCTLAVPWQHPGTLATPDHAPAAPCHTPSASGI
jgi:hypothetical protein